MEMGSKKLSNTLTLQNKKIEVLQISPTIKIIKILVKY